VLANGSLAVVGNVGDNRERPTLLDDEFKEPLSMVPPARARQPPPAPSAIRSVAAGKYHLVVLRDDGSVRTTGLPVSPPAEVALPPPGSGGVESVHAGEDLSFAVMKESGRVVSWGTGLPPALAALLPTLGSSPAADVSTSHVKTIAMAGARQPGFMILFRNGTMLNYTGVNAGFAGIVQGVSAVSASLAASLGGPHFLAVLSDGGVSGVEGNSSGGRVVAWGNDNTGQGASGAARLAPDIAAGGGAAGIAAGGRHSLVLLRNGSVVGFGRNDFQQTNAMRAIALATGVGVLNHTSGSNAAAPPLLPAVTAVGAGELHSVALLASGRLVVWGSLLGLGSPQSQLLPANVTPPDVPAVAVSASPHHTVVLRADGGVVAFGADFHGETQVPAELQPATAGGGGGSGGTGSQTTAVAVAAGYNHSLALTSSGRVVSFGLLGDDTVPDAARAGVTAIAAGDGFSAAIQSNGSLLVWATNANASLPVLTMMPDFSSKRVTAIAAGQCHMLAVLSDGDVRAWCVVRVACARAWCVVLQALYGTPWLRTWGESASWTKTQHGQCLHLL
jgi:alpha-tubulin suppressor-like RCC1 family protein